ncbi:MAG: hypothetical protein KBT70_04185 [Roseovarius sp.]|uniref:hypothetical protein n=1 Tax=Roseovarius sp. TaxID=1486281 RepID=UPI001B51EE60|nr:hypothetical protein [Roseovarius sp.]MBQ0749378.1 hypothetical protein [Roseovarius sp.]MBQ0809012.1 hypothetical protein [Roseovarius sp.]
MKTVLFHVGMPKCATTTIQSFLTERVEWLEAQGFSYTKHSDDPTQHQGNAAQLAEYAMNGPRARVAEHLDFFLRSEGNVLLSSEMLFGLGRGNGFEAIQKEVLRRGFDLRVIVYLKRQDLWIESDYKQHVKDGNLWDGEFADLLALRRSKHTLDYHFILSSWAKQVGRARMHVVPLNPSQEKGYAIDSFLAVLGLSRPEAEVAVPSRNVSPSASATEAAREVKRHLIASGASHEDVRRLISAFLEVAQEVNPATRDDSLLSPEARRALLQDYAQSNAALSRDFLGGKPAFDDLPEAAPEAWVAPVERVPGVLAGVIARSMVRVQDEDIAPVQDEGPVSFFTRIKTLLNR